MPSKKRSFQAERAIGRRDFVAIAGGGALACLLGGLRSARCLAAPARSPLVFPVLGGDAYKVAKDGVKEAATLTGIVKWEGDIPEPFKFDLMLKPDDLQHSRRKEGETTKDSARLVVDRESRGVRHAVVTVEGIAEGKPWPERKVQIEADHCEFFPHVVWIQAGKSFVGRNNDPIPNSMHAYRGKVGGDTVFNWLLPTKGDTKSEPLEEPGLLMVVCDSGHKWESAYIFVSAHPYVDVTDEKGRFSIAGIPPGNYQVKFWHEGWGVKPRRNAEGKVEDYLYSKDLVHTADLSFGPKEAKEIGVKLGEDGFRA